MSPSPGVITAKATDHVIRHTLIQLQKDVGGVMAQEDFFFFDMI